MFRKLPYFERVQITQSSLPNEIEARYARAPRAIAQERFEIAQCRLVALGAKLDRSVRSIANPSIQAEAPRRLPRGVTKANALNAAADDGVSAFHGEDGAAVRGARRGRRG